MVPSPGTPVGGNRPRRRRSNSPDGTAAAAAAGPPDSAMEVDDAGLWVPRRVHCLVPFCPCSDYPRTGMRIEGRLLSASRFGAHWPALSVTQRQEMAIFLAKQDTGTIKRLVQPFCRQALALIHQKESRSRPTLSRLPALYMICLLHLCGQGLALLPRIHCPWTFWVALAAFA